MKPSQKEIERFIKNIRDTYNKIDKWELEEICTEAFRTNNFVFSWAIIRKNPKKELSPNDWDI